MLLTLVNNGSADLVYAIANFLISRKVILVSYSFFFECLFLFRIRERFSPMNRLPLQLRLYEEFRNPDAPIRYR